MDFKNISIDGHNYGDVEDMGKNEIIKRRRVTNVDFKDSRIFSILANIND
jgi:hypothetical protein